MLENQQRQIETTISGDEIDLRMKVDRYVENVKTTLNGMESVRTKLYVYVVACSLILSLLRHRVFCGDSTLYCDNATAFSLRCVCISVCVTSRKKIDLRWWIFKHCRLWRTCYCSFCQDCDNCRKEICPLKSLRLEPGLDVQVPLNYFDLASTGHKITMHIWLYSSTLSRCLYISHLF